MKKHQLNINIERLLSIHLAIIGLLASCHIAANSFAAFNPKRLNNVIAFFNMVEERSLVNFVSASALLIASSTAALIATSSRGHERVIHWGWWMTSAILLILAIDEGAGFHDLLSGFGQAAMDSHGLLFIGWIVPYLLLGTTCLALLLPFIITLNRVTMIRLSVAGTIYVASAMGFEMVEGLLMDNSVGGGSLSAVDIDAINRTATMIVLVTFEEVGEMFGVALALRALLIHFKESCPDFRLTLTSRDDVNSPASVAPYPNLI